MTEEELKKREKAIKQRFAMNGALALFFPMTAAWHRLLLMSSSSSSSLNDSRSSAAAAAALAVVVALHAFADFAAAFSLKLQGPSWRSR